jgi:hypothetical protein
MSSPSLVYHSSTVIYGVKTACALRQPIGRRSPRYRTSISGSRERRPHAGLAHTLCRISPVIISWTDYYNRAMCSRRGASPAPDPFAEMNKYVAPCIQTIHCYSFQFPNSIPSSKSMLPHLTPNTFILLRACKTRTRLANISFA